MTTTTERARAALGNQGIPAPTDRQIEAVIARAGLALAAGDPSPMASAAAEVAKETR